MGRPPKTPTGTPTPPRRKAAARKPTRTSTAAPKTTAKAARALADQADAVVDTVKDAAADVAKPVGDAVKPVRDAVKPAAKRAARAIAAKAPPKPRAAATTRNGRKTGPRTAPVRPAPVKLVADTREKMGDRNFFAALVGGLAAVGAAITGIFLATKATATDAKPNPGERAHQPDGTDSSKSFEAGIADEGTIPE